MLTVKIGKDYPELGLVLEANRSSEPGVRIKEILVCNLPIFITFSSRLNFLRLCPNITQNKNIQWIGKRKVNALIFEFLFPKVNKSFPHASKEPLVFSTKWPS